jgi:hypothetical protein
MENIIAFIQNKMDELITEELEERDMPRVMWLSGQMDALMDTMMFTHKQIEIESYNG